MTTINKIQSSLPLSATGASRTAVGGGEDFKAQLSAILDETRATVRETMEEMNERQKERDTVKAERETDETLMRLMPDGSIRIIEVEGGEVVATTKYRPHMQTVIDNSQPLPQNADGTANLNAAETKLEPLKSVFNLMPVG